MTRAALVAQLAALALLLALVLTPDVFKPVFEPLTENGAPAINNQGSLLVLTLDHLGLVAASSLGWTASGVSDWTHLEKRLLLGRKAADIGSKARLT
jgi:hypothetical protein